MIVSHTIADVRQHRRGLKTLALVPTMGALHVGHMSLIDIARKHAEHVAVSIFVNPTQFGPSEDYQKYPRPIEEDLAKCRDAAVDLVFNPGVEEMYPTREAGAAEPPGSEIQIDLPSLSTVLEGRVRPNHFKGVCQVVGKLFNILTPDVACFGQKDYQQLRIIETMVAAMDWPIRIVQCPTVREPDGLAMSSRNQFLTPPQRQRALSIGKGLHSAQEQFDKGVRQTNRLIATVQNTMLDPGMQGRVPLLIDYVAAVDAMNLKNVETICAPVLLAVAARVGTTRLIDNVLLLP